MGRHWRKVEIGGYRLGRLNGQAVAVWRDDDGHHRYRLGHAATEAEATSLLSAFAHAQIAAEPAAVTVGTLFRAYMDDRAKDGKRMPAFRDNWKALAPFFEELRPLQIDADLCRAYGARRIEQGVSVGTVWSELTRLRSAMNWARKRRVIAEAPYVWLPAKPAPRDRVLTPAEATKLIDACVMPHVKLFVVLALATGGRSGALLELTWDRVDFEGEVIDLRSTVTHLNPLTKRAMKGRAVVPMSGMARAALAEAREGSLSNWVVEWCGEPVKSIRKGFSEACRRAKLVGVTPHTLRHSHATWAVEGGQSFYAVSRMLGHKDSRTTERIYAKPSPWHIRGVADAVGLRLVGK